MPTYEFTCPQGHDFEKFYRSIGSAPGEVVCPICGRIAERRLSAGAGLVFKGSGFYITDYGKDGKKDQQAARASAGDSKSGDSNSGDSNSGESKSGESKSGEVGIASSSSSDSKGGSESKPSRDGAAPKAAEAAPAPKSTTPTAKTAE